jgi:hypothetical protein
MQQKFVFSLSCVTPTTHLPVMRGIEKTHAEKPDFWEGKPLVEACMQATIESIEKSRVTSVLLALTTALTFGEES